MHRERQVGSVETESVVRSCRGIVMEHTIGIEGEFGEGIGSLVRIMLRSCLGKGIWIEELK